MKADVRKRDGLWTFHFRAIKEGIKRWVVLHDALVDEGFLEAQDVHIDLP